MTAAIRDNRAEIVCASVSGQIAPVRIHGENLAVNKEGCWQMLPASGGIALGIHAGDPVSKLLGDHLIAGLSIEDAGNTPAVPGPLHLLSCIGNRVRDGRGRPLGIISGKRGGLAPGFWAPQLVGVEIADSIAQHLTPEDRIVVETVGRGLRLLDWPQIEPMNLSPQLLDVLPLSPDGEGLRCAVTAVVPPESAGPGIGQDAWIGDLEITTDRCLVGSLDALCFGDIVAFADIDSRAGRFFSPGRVSIGVVSHGPGLGPGHGVGATIILTGPSDILAVSVGKTSFGRVLRHRAEDLQDQAP